jgi:hypothetical protein
MFTILALLAQTEILYPCVAYRLRVLRAGSLGTHVAFHSQETTFTDPGGQVVLITIGPKQGPMTQGPFQGPHLALVRPSY